MELGELKKAMEAADRVVDVYRLQNEAIDDALISDKPRDLIHQIQMLGLRRRIMISHGQGGEQC